MACPRECACSTPAATAREWASRTTSTGHVDPAMDRPQESSALLREERLSHGKAKEIEVEFFRKVNLETDIGRPGGRPRPVIPRVCLVVQADCLAQVLVALDRAPQADR